MELVDLVRDRDRVYGDCLPKSPQPAIGAWRSPHTRLTSVSFASAPKTNMKNVWFGARSAEGRRHQGAEVVGVGGWGGLTGRGRHAGGKASRGWAAEGAATMLYKGWGAAWLPYVSDGSLERVSALSVVVCVPTATGFSGSKRVEPAAQLAKKWDKKQHH